MWRASSRYRSRKTVASPNAEAASRRAASTACFSSPGWPTIRMPLPPPPAAAFTITGRRSTSVDKSTSSTESVPTSIDGRIGTPASPISRLAASLSPITSMTSGGGPIQTRPAPITARATSRARAGEEAVTRVYRVGVGEGGRLEEAFDVQVGVSGRRPLEGDGERRLFDEGPVPITLGEYGGRFDAHADCGPSDPSGYLAPVRNEDAVSSQPEHPEPICSSHRGVVACREGQGDDGAGVAGIDDAVVHHPSAGVAGHRHGFSKGLDR